MPGASPAAELSRAMLDWTFPIGASPKCCGRSTVRAPRSISRIKFWRVRLTQILSSCSKQRASEVEPRDCMVGPTLYDALRLDDRVVEFGAAVVAPVGRRFSTSGLDASGSARPVGTAVDIDGHVVGVDTLDHGYAQRMFPVADDDDIAHAQAPAVGDRRVPHVCRCGIVLVTGVAGEFPIVAERAEQPRGRDVVENARGGIGRHSCSITAVSS